MFLNKVQSIENVKIKRQLRFI